MEPMYLSIRMKETGQRIKKMLLENGYTVRDIQDVCGFENPQAIYKWLSGRSLPSIDNFVILSRMLHTSIEDILVIDGDFFEVMGCKMAKACQLFSGSKGNSIYISSACGKFLVDAGVSAKRLDEKLRSIGVEPDELDGIFVTHEHTDHI